MTRMRKKSGDELFIEEIGRGAAEVLRLISFHDASEPPAA